MFILLCNLCLKGSKRTCEDKQDELDEESSDKESSDKESSDKESSDKESSNLECMSSDNSHVDKFIKNTDKPSKKSLGRYLVIIGILIK